jgi:CHAT domain-containing protein
MVVLANPDFANASLTDTPTDFDSEARRSSDIDRGGLTFRPLANTALEADALKKALNLDASQLLTGRDATESIVKSLQRPRILHIASHGFFLSDQELAGEITKRTKIELRSAPRGENPLLRSGIALAGANKRRSGNSEDGILTAMEAAQLDLIGTELVVLSACDTAVGEVVQGEGVYGLRRAIVLAGAQTQITSLWKVSDASTRDLMGDIYAMMINGVGRAAAVRNAQLKMLANAEYEHPYYLASFIPIGNWTPLPTIQ